MRECREVPHGIAYAEAVRRGDGQIVFSLLLEAIDVAWNLRHSLSPTSLSPNPYHGRLWAHSDRLPDPAKAGPWSIEQWVPEQADVETVAADYLKHRWMSHGHVDWCLVDALTRREIVGYEAYIATTFPRPWTTAWVIQRAFTTWASWLIEALIAAGSFAWLRVEFFSPDESPYRW